MTTSRGESQPPPFARRRAETIQSVLPPASVSPLQFGDSRILSAWVDKDFPAVVFKHVWWPGVTEGEIVRVTPHNVEGGSSGFLFIVPKDDGGAKSQLQLGIPKVMADIFGIKNNGEVTVTKVDKRTCSADYVELFFQDQYLGRNDMWRLLKSKVGECLYTEQEISFIGGSGANAGGGAGGPANPNPTPLKTITAKIRAIYIGGEKVSSGYTTTGTKAIFRSSSAKITIFIQICREFWEFAGDGERYYEKIVHSFLPALFTKWKDAGTNHIVSIVLVSRVHYEQAEIDYAAGPLRRDEDGTWYKDFYKVITDLEVIRDWRPTLVSLKNSFWDFQRDILLNHHYHQTSHDTASDPPEEVRLVGRISFAHDGPILEAINLALNPTETHYIDRSLSLTGSATILITPGTGYFRVSKHLLRLTTSRLLDSGFGLDLVSLAKPPLHQTPIFSFRGMEPALKVPELPSARDMDPLWGGDDDPKEAAGREKTLFWWEPFWMCVSFWDQQLDLPFREDRFVARAKMHDIQMLGLLEQDVLSTVEIPFLPPRVEYAFASSREAADGRPISKRAADQFDNDVFALQRPSKSTATARNSMISSGSGTIMASSYSSSTDRRSSMSRHNSHFIAKSTRIAPIEESPRPITKDLPSEEAVTSKSRVATMSRQRSTSLSKASIRSTQSHQSTLTAASADSQQPPPSTRSSLASKLTPSWLLNPFRSAPSEVQAVSVSATGSNNATPSATPDITPKLSSIRLPNVIPAPAISSSPAPVTISMNSSGRSALAGFWGLDERDQYFNRSPMNTPPLEEPSSYARSNMSSAHAFSIPLASTSPGSPSNPCKPRTYLSREQASLSHRWQHLYPQMHYKHQIKWKSMVTPGCLPLTVEYFPTTGEIESSYVVASYDFVIDPPVRSFLIKPPPAPQGTKEEVRRQWAFVVMRAMVAVRLAQGFQFVLRPQGSVRGSREDRDSHRRIKAFELGDDATPKPTGAAEVLATDPHPVYLSMSNEIHRISYTGDAIQVRRYVRRMPPSPPIQYQCLIWPKLGGGYTELETTFASHGLENYGWNRVDMLVAGYEHQFNESLRYWRTRFIVIPTAGPPNITTGANGEPLSEEEIRIHGIEKLADIFTKLRWVPPEDKSLAAPVKFVHTTLSPVASVLDELVLTQLDGVHAAGPLKKNMKSERKIASMSLVDVARAMRELDGITIKTNVWRQRSYYDSFTGTDFVNWLVREFNDVSSRAQATELGVRFLDQGLFIHCKGSHGFLDGHYFYMFTQDYVNVNPLWWGRGKPAPDARKPNPNLQDSRRRLILSQSMVIDVDPGPHKKSDQAETVILHHDIIHNPENVFHFELQWIGTTAQVIEDQIRSWSARIEGYGLTLVEAYVTQISDIRERNPFQSCFPIRLCVNPPVIPDLHLRIPPGTPTKNYFEYALLREFDFTLDTEASDMYPTEVDVHYSYRRSACDYSQFVHRSGVAFVQVLGGERGFVLLSNRLMGPGRMGTVARSRNNKAANSAEAIRVGLNDFCKNEEALNAFYQRQIELLPPIAERSPLTSISDEPSVI